MNVVYVVMLCVVCVAFCMLCCVLCCVLRYVCCVFSAVLCVMLCVKTYPNAFHVSRNALKNLVVPKTTTVVLKTTNFLKFLWLT